MIVGERDLNMAVNSSVEDARTEMNSLVASIWGGGCLTDDRCARSFAYCDRSQGLAAKLAGLSKLLYN